MNLSEYFSQKSHINWVGNGTTNRVSPVSLCTQVWGHLDNLDASQRKIILDTENAKAAFDLLVQSGFMALAKEPEKPVAFWKVSTPICCCFDCCSLKPRGHPLQLLAEGA